MILPYPSGFWDFADSPFLPAFFVKIKKATDTFHGLIIKIKKPWGLIRLTHGFHSIARGSEAWVNPPKAKKEKVFVEPGHHILWYSFYYFICHNVKGRIENLLRFLISSLSCPVPIALCCKLIALCD
jgi:hypothetical protein